MRDRTKRTLTVVIDNVTEAQEIALNDLFATWQSLGGIGGSRWTAFYADGDGDFRPKITVNGEKAKFTDLLDRKKLWEGDEYRIDFDAVGWKLQAIEDKEDTCTPENPDRTKYFHNWPDVRPLVNGEVSGDMACQNCGLLWRETKFYTPPVDWTNTPHEAMFAEGGEVCLRCKQAWGNPLHVKKLDYPSEQQNEAET